MKRIALLLAAVAAAVVGARAALAHTARATVQAGVVIVNTNLAFHNGAAAGTGIVLTSSGEVVTNNHVIRGASRITVVDPRTHRRYAARIVGYDVADDIAVLQLRHATGLATVALGSSAGLKVGQPVTAVGNAGGTGSLTVTTGTITGLARAITVADESGAEALAGLVETDAQLQPGDSGGPLLDSGGRVIGIDTAASSGFSFRNANDGYAIPIDKVVTVARQVVAGHGSASVHVGRTAFLGVSVQSADAYGGGGILVGGVIAGGPAAKGGLGTGDIITSVDRRAVASQNALVAALLLHHPGDRVTVAWTDRIGDDHAATVTLASGPPQ
ncbi:MAG: trypsin-like peptidase domain-containing protein [Acidobacteriota bacterium]|nr:trypsin-like peptidase domain-containing protein [Acidobacteriota bacterium]